MGADIPRLDFDAVFSKDSVNMGVDCRDRFQGQLTSGNAGLIRDDKEQKVIGESFQLFDRIVKPDDLIRPRNIANILDDGAVAIEKNCCSFEQLNISRVSRHFITAAPIDVSQTSLTHRRSRMS
jgi:hypothetical protein